jgi:hypothetical protein
VVQVLELPSTCETLSSNPNAVQKKKTLFSESQWRLHHYQTIISFNPPLFDDSALVEISKDRVKDEKYSTNNTYENINNSKSPYTTQ